MPASSHASGFGVTVERSVGEVSADSNRGLFCLTARFNPSRFQVLESPPISEAISGGRLTSTDEGGINEARDTHCSSITCLDPTNRQRPDWARGLYGLRQTQLGYGNLIKAYLSAGPGIMLTTTEARDINMVVLRSEKDSDFVIGVPAGVIAPLSEHVWLDGSVTLYYTPNSQIIKTTNWFFGLGLVFPLAGPEPG